MEEGYIVKVLDYDVLQADAQALWGNRVETVRFPSDRDSGPGRNGPCQVYQLGRPMTMAELERLPKDLQQVYLRGLRQHGGTKEAVSTMLGVSAAQLSRRWKIRFDMPNPTAWAAFLGKC